MCIRDRSLNTRLSIRVEVTLKPPFPTQAATVTEDTIHTLPKNSLPDKTMRKPHTPLLNYTTPSDGASDVFFALRARALEAFLERGRRDISCDFKPCCLEMRSPFKPSGPNIVVSREELRGGLVRNQYWMTAWGTKERLFTESDRASLRCNVTGRPAYGVDAPRCLCNGQLCPWCPDAELPPPAPKRDTRFVERKPGAPRAKRLSPRPLSLRPPPRPGRGT